jgi:hypothetical protein
MEEKCIEKFEGIKIYIRAIGIEKNGSERERRQKKQTFV